MSGERVVGVVGLGNMGGVIAARLARSGPVTGFDADPARCEAAAGVGVEIAEGVAGVAAAAETVLLSLPRPDISRAVLEDALGGLGAGGGGLGAGGGLVIETSTIGPDDARAAHRRAAEAGVGYVDAAILSGVEQVRDGTSAFLVGGEPGDVERAEPVLRRICERVMRFAGPGTGMAAKVINNAVAHAEMVVLAEAAALAGAEGIALDRLCELLDQDDAGVKRPLSGRLPGRVRERRYDGGMPTEAARKDSTLALEMARAAGVPLFAMQAADTVYELALRAGLARKDYASIATLWED
jgi:3-hydroxyisobutyrate dehydrogenase-like beta-hydroxyacid dehydrogenase